MGRGPDPCSEADDRCSAGTAGSCPVLVRVRSEGVVFGSGGARYLYPLAVSHHSRVLAHDHLHEFRIAGPCECNRARRPGPLCPLGRRRGLPHPGDGRAIRRLDPGVGRAGALCAHAAGPVDEPASSLILPARSTFTFQTTRLPSPGQHALAGLRRSAGTGAGRNLDPNTKASVPLHSAGILPPCASTIDRVIDSPMPRPATLVVTKGLKMCSRSSSLTPTPVSRTHTSTVSPAPTAVSTVSRRGPCTPSDIAAFAFSTRFRITCWIWTASPRTGGSPGRSRSSVETPARARSASRKLSTSRMSALPWSAPPGPRASGPPQHCSRSHRAAG